MERTEKYELVIDDEQQIIQGVKIVDREIYLLVKSVVEISVLSGWQPVKKEIQVLYDEALHPDPKLEKEYQEIFGEEE